MSFQQSNGPSKNERQAMTIEQAALDTSTALDAASLMSLGKYTLLNLQWMSADYRHPADISTTHDSEEKTALAHALPSSESELNLRLHSNPLKSYATFEETQPLLSEAKTHPSSWKPRLDVLTTAASDGAKAIGSGLLSALLWSANGVATLNEKLQSKSFEELAKIILTAKDSATYASALDDFRKQIKHHGDLLGTATSFKQAANTLLYFSALYALFSQANFRVASCKSSTEIEDAIQESLYIIGENNAFIKEFESKEMVAPKMLFIKYLIRETEKVSLALKKDDCPLEPQAKIYLTTRLLPELQKHGAEVLSLSNMAPDHACDKCKARIESGATLFDKTPKKKPRQKDKTKSASLVSDSPSF